MDKQLLPWSDHSKLVPSTNYGQIERQTRDFARSRENARPNFCALPQAYSGPSGNGLKRVSRGSPIPLLTTLSRISN